MHFISLAQCSAAAFVSSFCSEWISRITPRLADADRRIASVALFALRAVAFALMFYAFAPAPGLFSACTAGVCTSAASLAALRCLDPLPPQLREEADAHH